MNLFKLFELYIYERLIVVNLFLWKRKPPDCPVVLLCFSIESLIMKSAFVIIKLQFAACKKTKEVRLMQGMNILSHTKWNCKYHIIFDSKYRRKVFYGDIIFKWDIESITSFINFFMNWIFKLNGVKYLYQKNKNDNKLYW